MKTCFEVTDSETAGLKELRLGGCAQAPVQSQPRK